MNIRDELARSTRTLQDASFVSSSLDAELLLAHCIGKERAHILAFGEQLLTEKQQKSYRDLIDKRVRNVPLAYLVGSKNFFGHEFYVNKYTLIPRPETELLVAAAVEYLNEHSDSRLSVLDVGTGSGCIIISIALAVQRSGFMMGIDRVKRALELAKKNAEKHGVANRILFKRYNMLSLVKDKRFDIIVANLPYLSPVELVEARRTNLELAHEPQIALLGGKDGMLFQKQLIAQARKRLKPNGVIFMEIGDTQGTEIEQVAHQYLDPCSVEIKKDLCVRDRMAVIRTGAVSPVMQSPA
ncbi:peptide chain release factor N(5)-glutamine methyltransferase [Candidatus Uhrbacteria bacterium]|nr:peptide chain release factor N(5)-glutamine methyltransferase [Candidatus Uhrbacteria bacterium]